MAAPGKFAVRCLATAGIAVLFLLVPGRLLYENFASGGAQELMGQSPSLSPPAGGSHYGTPEGVYLLRRPSLCLAFEFLGVDPANSVATFGIQVDVTSRGKQMIRQFEQGSPGRGRHGTGKRGPRYQNISLVVKSGAGLSSLVIPIPSSALLAAHPSTCGAGSPTAGELGQLDRNAAFRTTQNILVLGQPRAFPQDWYQASESVAMLAGRGTYGLTLPASLIIAAQNQDVSLGVHLDDPTAQASGKNDPLLFIIRRPTLIIWYTYIIGLLPFVLLITLILVAYITRRAADIYQVALGVAATMVAILPLRAVLVPSSVPGLTRLDIFFGAGISLLVIVSFLCVVVWPVKSRQ